jgi:hypothetical protein
MAEGSLPATRLLPAVGPRSRRPAALRTEPTHHCGSAQDRRQVSLLKTTPNGNARLRLLGHADHDRRAVAPYVADLRQPAPCDLSLGCQRSRYGTFNGLDRASC